MCIRDSRSTAIATLLQSQQGEARLRRRSCAVSKGSASRLKTWKEKYGGTERGDAKEAQATEGRDPKAEAVVVELTLDNRALKDVLSKKHLASGLRAATDPAGSPSVLSKQLDMWQHQ